jgi:hypothetical protein
VCVIDSGVDTDTDVAPAIVSRYANDGGSPDDVGALGDGGTTLTKHGTYVSGVIASQLDGRGASGIWPMAKVVSVRVFTDPMSDTAASDYITAILRCETRPNVKVINLSLGGLASMTQQERDDLQDAITNAHALYGINVVAAVGNEGLPVVAYPAAFNGVFGVGATNPAGSRWTSSTGGSNYGAALDISTLGQDVCVSVSPSIAPESTLGKARGTSFAAPIVSAVIAAMRSYAPSISADQAEAALLATATTASAGKTLNAAAAFQHAATYYSAPQLAALVSGYASGAAFDCTAPPTGAGGGAAAAGAGLGTRPAETVPAAQAPPPQTAMPVDAASTPITPAQPVERPVSTRTATPKLRSVKLSRGVLCIRISGYRRGMTATFRVDRKRYVRKASTLKVRVRTWETVRVQLEQRGRLVSQTLVVRRGEEF